ncbi:phosphodiesterase [Falsirhodobacter algicola]|uniref:Phosphodiesterase n=1 Tax=Falsirhodobacter algicola TaxID=2692330 RepID=A0A8J8SKQ3_9RHOB|nr:phosphodiesterase [Falsirhodobacter algicola]QUS36220.1 phosphodiesterase [Falsirhodobacter algicola]
MKIIQLTDTHLMPPGHPAYGVDPEAQLRAAMADILADHADADLLVITGDLSDRGDPEAYALLRDILAPLPCPVRLMLGNHDHRPAFLEAFPDHPRDEGGYVQSVLDTRWGRLLFLDTHEAGVIGGIYGPDRLAWLDAALAGAGDRPVTVFLHHPPVSDGIRHFRDIGLHDDGAVLRRLAAHPGGVRHIVFGHIHTPLTGTTAEGIAFSSGQSCTHRFITNIDLPDPWWTGGNPCYRILTLDDGGFRAYGVEVGQVPTGRSEPCAGP